MSEQILKVQPRSETGKGPNRRLRASGQVPAVLYARGTASVHFSFVEKDLRAALKTPRRRNTVVTLQFPDGRNFEVLLKDYQVEPVSRAVIHADFMGVHEGTAIRVDVPVRLTGKAKGVVDGGILGQPARFITVECNPKDIPDEIVVDVTPITLGHSIHVSELTPPAGVKYVYSADYPVALVSVAAEETAAATAAAAPAGEVPVVEKGKKAAEGAAGAAAAPAKDAKKK
ncbi:MAG: General stress protein CTC [Myxococcota bacterium]|nr:General stress protein CTC [Myxococcota bacterium]